MNLICPRAQPEKKTTKPKHSHRIVVPPSKRAPSQNRISNFSLEIMKKVALAGEKSARATTTLYTTYYTINKKTIPT